MVNTYIRDAFWSVVEDCLALFHGWPRGEAKQAADLARRRVESLGSSGEIVYHSEPFSLACDIAGKQPNIGDHEEAYERVLKERGW
jgi:hypothetical protein